MFLARRLDLRFSKDSAGIFPWHDLPLRSIPLQKYLGMNRLSSIEAMSKDKIVHKIASRSNLSQFSMSYFLMSSRK